MCYRQDCAGHVPESISFTMLSWFAKMDAVIPRNAKERVDDDADGDN